MFLCSAYIEVFAMCAKNVAMEGGTIKEHTLDHGGGNSAWQSAAHSISGDSLQRHQPHRPEKSAHMAQYAMYAPPAENPCIPLRIN